jgi:uncharacterized protein (DUF983 family)
MNEPQTRFWARAMWRGLRLKCPHCGEGALMAGYAKVAPACDRCGEDLHHHRADDAPPYFTIFAVGHIIVPLLLVVEKIWKPDLWIHFALWLPATLALTLWLLPRTKGATVGLQWAFRMHGFGDPSATPASPKSTQP